MNTEELSSIKGGVCKEIVWGGIVVLISFLIGVIDGYNRPLGCN